MHVRTLSMAIGLLAVIAGACKGPVVPSPLTGQTRFLCCNVRYERPEITDNFYQVGTLIPFGTPVTILEVRPHSVKFQASGHPPITVVEKYGAGRSPSISSWTACSWRPTRAPRSPEPLLPGVAGAGGAASLLRPRVARRSRRSSRAPSSPA